MYRICLIEKGLSRFDVLMLTGRTLHTIHRYGRESMDALVVSRMTHDELLRDYI